MPTTTAPPDVPDPLLAAYLDATDHEADAHLAEVVTGPVERVVRGIVARVVGPDAAPRRPGGPEPEDVRAEVLLLVVARLQQARADRSAPPIQNLLGYVSGIAYRTAYTHLRRLDPGRAALTARVRETLARDPSLVLDVETAGVARAALAEWSADDTRRVSDAFLRDPAAVVRDAASEGAVADEPLAEVLARVLRAVGAPVEVSALVTGLAPMLGPTRATPATAVPVDDLAERLGSDEPAVPVVLMRREYLAHLWAEVQELPARQRAAVLLNLRDADGQSALPLLPLTGVATVRQIAAALEMPAEELARIWRTLPHDDLTIAGRFGLTRQQVINLRKSARDRLGRRMRLFGGRPA